MNYISQYDDKMSKEKGKHKKIDTGGKWKVNASATFFGLTKASYCFSIFHMRRKTIKHVGPDKTISQFCIGYMSISFSKQNKISDNKLKTFTPRFDTKTSQAMKNY